MIISGVIGFFIGLLLTNAGIIVIDFIKTKPKIEIQMQTTQWKGLDKLIDLNYLNDEMLISTGKSPFNENKVLLMFKSIDENSWNSKTFSPYFDYPYMENCKDCFQNWIIIKNKGKIPAEDIKLYLKDRFELIEIIKTSPLIEYNIGEGPYYSEGLVLTISKLEVGEEVAFSFSTKDKFNFFSNCEVKNNRNYCEEKITETYALKLSEFEARGFTSFQFSKYNTSLKIPEIQEPKMYKFNVLSGELKEFEGELINIGNFNSNGTC